MKRPFETYKRILKDYPKRNFFYSSLIPFFISLLFLLWYIYLGRDLLVIIKQLCSLIIQIIPGILGFILTGYALIIGFSRSDIIKKMSESPLKNKKSLFEILNSTFAIIITIMALSIFFAILVKFIFALEISLDNNLPCYINFFVAFFLLYVLLYNVLAIKDIVFNIFMFGKFVHTVNKNEKNNYLNEG